MAAMGIAAIASSARAHADDESRARSIHNRLAGVPASRAVLDSMITLIKAGNPEGAAAVAMSNDGFINITAVSFAKPLMNREESPVATLNDGAATVALVIRDNLDARELLTGNYIAVADPTKIPGGVTIRSTDADIYRASANHYVDLEDKGVSYKTVLMKASQKYSADGNTFTALPASQAMGVQTSVAFSAAERVAGTGRRETEYAVKEFLCINYADVKRFDITDDHVRRDVARAPGGSTAMYQTNCVGCHAQQDAANVNGAFMDYNTGNGGFLTYTPGASSAKWNKNSNNNNPVIGASVIDQRWQIRWLDERFGFDTPITNGSWLEGDGPKAFGTALANSQAFRSCMVKRVIKQVCRREPAAGDAGIISNLADSFKADGYKLQTIFRKLAANPSCISN